MPLDILRGARVKKVMDGGFDRKPSFGKGAHRCGARRRVGLCVRMVHFRGGAARPWMRRMRERFTAVQPCSVHHRVEQMLQRRWLLHSSLEWWKALWDLIVRVSPSAQPSLTRSGNP
jgi:hypothetical protein